MLRADQPLQDKLNAWAYWWAEKNKPKGWSPEGEQDRIDRRYTETSDNLLRHLIEGGYHDRRKAE